MTATYEYQSEPALRHLPISFRLGKPEDNGFIIASWLKANRNHYTNKFIPNEVYYPEQEKIVKRLLSQSQVYVTYLDDSPDTIIAYVVYQYAGDSLIVHYAYTKGSKDLYRGLGIQSAMLMMINPLSYPVAITTFPRQETLFAHMGRKYSVVFDPFFIHREIT